MDVLDGIHALGGVRGTERTEAKRDLLVCTHTPALGSGRAMRTYGIARALTMDGGLTLLYGRFGAEQPDVAFRSIPGIELHEVLPSRGTRRLATYVRARLAGVPADFARGVSPELAAAASRLAGVPGRGRVIADGPVAAAALAHLARERPVVYNAHNLESDFRHTLAAGRHGGLRGLRHGGLPALPRDGLHGLRSFERGLLARASESWIVSEADMRAARELWPDAKLRLVPNVVDVTAIAPIDGLAPEPRAIFVADFSYEPNRNALRFTLEEIMPRVWRGLPDARLMLVGAGLEPLAGAGREPLVGGGPKPLAGSGREPLVGGGRKPLAGSGLGLPPAADPRVEALGFVDDLAQAYARARCAIVPLLQGGGSPLKLLEALAYGLPTIATPRAVAGVQARNGEHLLVADGAEEFAQAVTRLLADGAPQLAGNGRRLVEQRYSIEALAALVRA